MVYNSNEKKIILFTIQGCVPCLSFKPLVEKVAKELNWKLEIYDLMKASFDIKKMAHTLDINVFPTIVVINGENINKIEGSVSENKIKSSLQDSREK